MTGPSGKTWARDGGVVALSLVLLALGLVATDASTAMWDASRLPFQVPWWVLMPGYLLVFQLRLDYDYRRESRSVYLTHLPLVIGMVFLAPWLHLAARSIAGAGSFLAARKGPLKLLFNMSLGVFEIGTATLLLDVVSGPVAADHFLWLGILAGVIGSELLGIGALQSLFCILGVPQSNESRLASLTSNLATSVVFGGASVIFVAAAWTEPLMLVAVIVVALGLIVGYRRHRLLSAQHEQTSSLQQFVRGLGALDLTTDEGTTVLDAARSLLHAAVLDLCLQTREGWQRVTLAEGQPSTWDTPPGDDILHGPFVGQSRLERGDRMTTSLVGESGLMGVLSVRERFGEDRAFGLHDLHLLETLAAELAGALERGRLQADLAIAATTDPLTGLSNLNETTTLLGRQLQDSAQGVFVTTIAVESFREVNDTLGHQVGDELLCEVTRRLQLAFPQALLGRIGGGRFAVCVNRNDFAGDLAMFGLGLRAQIEGGAQLGPVGTHIKLSVGCAQAPEHGSDAATLVRRAETAMYGARHANGGPVVWEPVYEVEGQRRLAVVMALRDAVSSGAIGVAYQPKVRTGDDSVAGVEALARWTHPALGAISPGEFIPLAEASGLMGPLTTLVLRQALTTCKGWQRRSERIGVAVNVSAETLLDPSFATEVAALLISANVSPDLLTLELTEGVVVNDPVLAAQRMQDLRRLGVKLSVDDFGTGYSSLTYLKGLPVDEVKIDKGFVDHVTEDMADRAVVRAVVDIAHTMGLKVVAEGVENNEQLTTLRELGVDEAQGYLLARPMAAMDVAQWLRRREASTMTADRSTPTLTMPEPRG